MTTTGEYDGALARARDSFAAVFGNGRLGLGELRRNLDTMMTEPALAEDISVEEVVVGDVAALQVTAGVGTGSGVLVWFHGGGYVMGSPRGYVHAAAALSRALRMPVIVPDYRLAPEHPFPAALDDAAAAVDAVVAQYGAENVAIGGDSAGGGLTFAVLVHARQRGAILPAVAVTVSPLADFTASGASIAANRDTDPVITERSLRNLGAAYLRDHERSLPLASPVFADLAGLPPVLLLASASEILLDDSVRLADAVQSAGGISALSVYADTCHAWTLFTDFLPAAQAGVNEIADFIRKSIPCLPVTVSAQ